jgi:chromosome segregation ATPase
MNQINNLQAALRELVKNGRIEDAIDLLDIFLKKEKITDRLISDSLITISSSYRNLIQSNAKGLIEYATYISERNKVTDSILTLIRDLPFIKPKVQKTDEAASGRSIALIALEAFQENSILDIRKELLSVDSLIINLLKEINEKEKQLIRLSSEAEIAVLKKEMEILLKRIEEEEQRYKDLKVKYEELKNEQEKVIELTNEIDNLKNQLIIKNEHVSVLEERFVFSDKLLKQKEVEIDNLKTRSSNMESALVVLKKKILWGILLGGVLISIGSFVLLKSHFQPHW